MRGIAIKAAKENYKDQSFIKDFNGYAVQLLKDTLTFVCLLKKGEDSDKPLKFLYKIKNDFAFKFCGGDLSKANKKELMGKVDSFRSEMLKHGKTFDTGINMDLVNKANEEIHEVTGILHKAIKHQVGDQQETQKLLEDTENIYKVAQEVEKNAQKMEPSCCKRFWGCSKPCIILFSVLIVLVVVYFIVAEIACDSANLFDRSEEHTSELQSLRRT